MVCGADVDLCFRSPTPPPSTPPATSRSGPRRSTTVSGSLRLGIISLDYTVLPGEGPLYIFDF
jgi:hypothetical protein